MNEDRKVKDHYDNHLGNFYSWMTGDFKEKQIEQESFFKRNHVSPVITSVAIDLGCGHGLQTISLVNCGFRVEAVDFNRQLLRELEAKKEAHALPVNLHYNNLISFLQEFDQNADVIVCMGDTLTHLPDIDSIKDLFERSYQKLITGGKFIISFRDLTEPLHDEQRFIPVRSDATRIHTCFLEYFPEYVKVYDILHEYEDFRWKQSVSWYPKLRLNVRQVEQLLMENNFVLKKTEMINRMIYMVAEK